MHAVLLDVDGTLLQSDDADGELYRAAVHSILGPIRMRRSWDSYKNVTDAGLLHEICADNELVMTPDVVDRVRTRFVESLSRHIRSAGPFPEIPGAKLFVLSLLKSKSHVVAYATGGWAASARLKLSSAGFPLDIPLASSDDYWERTSIMKHALTLLGRNFSSTTYYGDGPWDEDAARMLGWRFVAVGKGLAGITRYEALGA